jgi:hypothetical protein
LNRSNFLKALFVGVLVVSMTCSLYLYIQNLKLSSDYGHAVAEKTTEIKNLKDDMSGLETKLNQQTELLDSRKGFLESVSKAKAALIEAGKVDDVRKSWELVLSAQEVVYQEKSDPKNIAVQTAAVDKETGRLLERVSMLQSGLIKPNMIVDASDIFQDLPGLRTLPSNHPARQALDAVGGTDIKLGAAPVVCGRDDSLACSYPSGVILLADAFANGNYDYYYPIMMHEYAHHFEFKYGRELEESKGYEQLFGLDKEWLADCMAASKIPGYMSNYRYECSSEQKEYGAGAWKGIFP